MRRAERWGATRPRWSGRSRWSVALPGALGRGSAVTDEPFDPIPGDPDTLSATLRTFAQLGVGHVQLVLDPITVESIAALAPTLAALDG